MSDFSLTLVLQFKTSKIINDVAKVQIKSEEVTPFGGIFSIMEQFDSKLSSVIDSTLGMRCKLYDGVTHYLHVRPSFYSPTYAGTDPSILS